MRLSSPAGYGHRGDRARSTSANQPLNDMHTGSSVRALIHTARRRSRRALNAFVDALWPGRCAAMGTLLQPGEEPPFSSEVDATLRPLGWLTSWPSQLTAVDAVWAAYTWGPALGVAVRGWKYHRRRAIGRGLAGRLRRRLGLVWPPPSRPELARTSGEPVHVVPVPLHPARVRERGFEQTRVLASAVADALPAARCAHSALVRTRDTPPQAGLGAEARVRNVEGAFTVGELPPGPVVLVDDVLTTGATANAAALALREHGVETIILVTLAHAEPETPGHLAELSLTFDRDRNPDRNPDPGREQGLVPEPDVETGTRSPARPVAADASTARRTPAVAVGAGNGTRDRSDVHAPSIAETVVLR